jgi:hypothetical protein
MLPLDKDLQLKKSSLKEFGEITFRVLTYLPNVLSGSEEKSYYIIYSSLIAGTKKYVRPINRDLFIMSPGVFLERMADLYLIVEKLKRRELEFSEKEEFTIDSVLYTIQQSIGAGLDLQVDPNSARKHVGNRFEELIKAFFSEIGIPNKRVLLKIPYDTDEGTKNYVCENDLILSADPTLIADKYIHEREIVVSVKTTSKDRMGKMFMDKILLEKFVGHKLKVIGIFLNDVQRKEGNNISHTLVSGLFMVYNKFLTSLEGVYYLDPPPNAKKAPYNNHIKPFSKLVTEDLFKLLSP